MKGILIKISVCSFLFGIYLGSFFSMQFQIIILLIIWSVFLISLFRKKKIILFFLIFIIFSSSGYLRYQFSLPNNDESSVHYYQDEKNQHRIKGTIIENPDKRREKVNYILKVDSIYIKNELKQVSGRILFAKDLYPELNYGDKVEISGYLIEPAEFESFSYKNYLSIYSVYSVMYYPKVKILSKRSGSLFFSLLFYIKSNFEEQLNKLFPEPMASFEAGLLTGSRKGIPENLMQSFNLTGLTHIIAISGYNISLIIILVSSLFTNCPRRTKIPIIIIFIIVFTLFVGASAAVVRASIMGIISVIALWFGRQSQVINALLFSAFIMSFWNPQVLLYDVGFQLSFLATLGLIITGNSIQKFFSFLPKMFGLQEAFAMTLSAQVFALPVILLNFKRLSLISPVANVFVVPFIPFAMLFGFIGSVVSYLNFSLGFIIKFPAWLVLKYIITITHFLANLPFSSFLTPWFSKYFLIGYYLLLILFAYLIYPYFRNFIFRTGRLNI